MDQALLRRATSRSHAVVMVQVFAVTVMVFPSDLIIKTVGAEGYPAILIAYFMLLAWVAATLFGLHNPLHYRYPVRMALWVLWLVSLISYALIDPAVVTPLERASADRWLMQLAGVSGVILVTAECLRSREDIRRVLRALTWPAIAALVARKRAADQELRDLAGALAGGALAAAVASATFDSLSFPMFVNVQALILGLIGAVWLIVKSERKSVQDLPGLKYGRNGQGTVSTLKRAGIGVTESVGGN